MCMHECVCACVDTSGESMGMGVCVGGREGGGRMGD